MASVQADDQFDVFGGFMAEIEGYLPAIASNLQRLLQQPGDETLLEECHRYAHTIKSSAAMMGMAELRKLAIPMEALLARAYAGDVAITLAVVTTVEGTLTHMRRYLDGSRTGAEVASLLTENEQAYAALVTSAPAAIVSPASQDAGDRLAHLEDSALDELTLLLASGKPIDDHVAFPLEQPPAARTLAPADAAAPAPVEQRPAALSEQDEELVAAEETPAVEEFTRALTPEPEPTGSRPYLTVVPGGVADAEGLEDDGVPSLAAEWLAELLTPVAPKRRLPDPLPAPSVEELPAEELPVKALPVEEPLAAFTVSAAEQARAFEQRLAEQQAVWDARLAAERTRFAQEQERERRQAEERLQRQEEHHRRALEAAAEEKQQALDEQRDELEAQVRQYIEEELKPQLEEELREELSHEFEVAALLEPEGAAPRPVAAAPAARRAVAPDDPALAAEMREIFTQEADEHLQAIGEQVLALRAQPHDLEPLQALRRSVHTLKGAAATVGLRLVSDLCHQVESALDQSLEANARPEAATFALLLQSCDAIEGLVRGAADAEARAGALLQQLRPLTGVAPAGEEPGTPAAALAPLAISSATPVATPAAPPPLAHVPALVPAPTAVLPVDAAPVEPAPGGRAANALALRVTLDQLDRMLSTNHELIISGSSAEQRLQRLGRVVGDLRHAGSRLRTAGARMEKSRELAALLAGAGSWDVLPALLPAGQQPAAGAVPADSSWRAALERRANQSTEGGEFDALEMDRYTEFHRLAREVAEAALDVTTLDSEIEALLDDLRVMVKQQQQLHTKQNDVLLKVRMLPVRTLLPRVARAVQTVASKLGKTVEFLAEGEGTMLDRAVIEAVADALLHLARNAVDHGLEAPEERLARGKPEQGTVRLRARRDGTDVVITLADDGAGLNTERIWQAALDRGLVDASQRPAEAEIQRLIFASGMSTAEKVTDISGRGVGLDVVRANLQAARGSVEVESQPGVGTTFSIRVPVSLSLLAVSLVECAGDTYAIPLTLVRHVEKLPARRVVKTEQGVMVRHGARTYPVVELGEALGRAASREEQGGRRPFVFIRGHDGIVALAVDRLIGKREVVVKDLGRHLRTIKGIHGATVLGNGDLVLILDVPSLLAAQTPALALPALPMAQHQRQLLVVDDSPSVRRLTCAVFERQGWQTRPARDGIEALDLLREWRPDAVVTDIEMPRMDGFELLAILRRETEMADLPVVIVTSRAGEKHREKAASLGVNGYLVKPFREEDLLSTVEGTLLEPAASA